MLFLLRWKTFIRNYTRSAGRASRIIGVVFLVLFGLPFMGGIAVATFFGYRLLPPPANAEILFLVLTGIYLLWIVLPLLEFTVNEGLDISKLALFPLTRAELMLSLIFTSLLDVPTIGLLIVPWCCRRGLGGVASTCIDGLSNDGGVLCTGCGY